MRVLLLSVVLALTLTQGLGVLGMHIHTWDTPAHRHVLVEHGDGHVGHPDDLLPSDMTHTDPTTGTTTSPTPRAAPSVVVLASALALLVLVPMGWPHGRSGPSPPLSSARHLRCSTVLLV